MKLIKYLFLSISICALFAAVAFGQQADTSKKIYPNIEVEKFTIRQGVEYPADKLEPLVIEIVNELRETLRFAQVSKSGEATPAETPALKITGEIVKFEKGSRAMRYIVGMGTGKTKLAIDVKFIDVKTGAIVLQQLVDGDVSKGIFGGNSAETRSEVADEIVKIAKKNFTEDTKKKSK